MITTNEQYEYSKDALESFESAQSFLKENKSSVTELEFEFESNTNTHIIIKLRTEIKEYEVLISGESVTYQDFNIDDLSKILKSSRLNKGLSCEELGKLAGLSIPSDLSGMEQRCYETTSLATVLNIIDGLGLELNFKEIVL